MMLENKIAIVSRAPGAGVIPPHYRAILEQGTLLKRLPTLAARQRTRDSWLCVGDLRR